jgi:hypothetical protein
LAGHFSFQLISSSYEYFLGNTSTLYWYFLQLAGILYDDRCDLGSSFGGSSLKLGNSLFNKKIVLKTALSTARKKNFLSVQKESTTTA